MHRDKSSRVNVVDMKALMLKKIGPERFKRYFYCLDRFINEKMCKTDFDRMCIRVLGKENLPLHNQIIKAILKNAFNAKLPPHVNHVGPANAATTVRKSSTSMEDGHVHGGFMSQNQNSGVPIWTNGVVLPMSPRKPRPGIRDWKLRDRPSPLGPNGKIDYVSHQSTATEDSGARTVNDGEQMPFDYQRPIQQFQGLAEQPVISEKVRLNNSSDVPDAILSKDQNNLTNREEIELAGNLNFSKSPLVAPFGIPFCSASVGGVRKSLPLINNGNFVSSFDSGLLSDSEGLRQRMEQIAAVHGLAGGVTMDCANSLNNMLDVYLRRLIKSCVQLVGEGSTSDPLKVRSQMHSKLMNGLLPSNHLHMQNVAGIMEEQRTQNSISLHDFRVAMDLQPQQLGQDWPLLIEKISMQASQASED